MYEYWTEETGMTIETGETFTATELYEIGKENLDRFTLFELNALSDSVNDLICDLYDADKWDTEEYEHAEDVCRWIDDAISDCERVYFKLLDMSDTECAAALDEMDVDDLSRLADDFESFHDKHQYTVVDWERDIDGLWDVIVSALYGELR